MKQLGATESDGQGVRRISGLKKFIPSPVQRRLKSLRHALRGGDPRRELLKTLPKNSIGAEIGVWKGEFSTEILKIVKPRELHLVDPWKFESREVYAKSLYGSEGAGTQSAMDEIYFDVVKQFRNNHAVKIHRLASADTDFPDDYFDWVYIDGNHRYEFAKADLHLFTRKVKPGGLVTGDDYIDHGWFKGGVKKAVDEAVVTGPLVLHRIIVSQFILRKQT